MSRNGTSSSQSLCTPNFQQHLNGSKNTLDIAQDIIQNNTNNSQVLHTSNKKTTRQVTVTKVVHEVNHFRPAGGLLDYAAVSINQSDGNFDAHQEEMCSLPPNVISRSLNYSNIDQLEPKVIKKEAVFMATDNNKFNSHFSDFENLSGIYPNLSNSADVSAPITAKGSNKYHLEYNSNQIHGNSKGSSDQNASPIPLPVLPTTNRPSAAFLQPNQFDDITDYRITPSPGIPSSHRYTEDPTLLYGYVSTPTYGISSNTASAPINSNSVYTTRPYIYDDSINCTVNTHHNGPMSSIARIFDDEHELQKHISEMSLQNSQQRPTESYIGMDDENCQQMRWRDPNLSEVISFLDSPNNIIKANAAAYLQHLCYMDDPNKQKTRTLGGIPPLVQLLSHETPEVYRNACGALRNLSYGRQNDENKRAIKNAGGIIALINLLNQCVDSDVKELVTGIVWNMSSCEDIKRAIIDEGLEAIVKNIIKPHSGWDPVSPGETCWSTVFRNSSGVLRNVSSAGEYARTKLRESDHLVDSLIHVVRVAIENNNIGNKIVENAVCVLRNLSYRCQEVDDPNYDKHPFPNAQRTPAKGENLGCFGGSKKKKESLTNEDNILNSGSQFGQLLRSRSQNAAATKKFEILWQPEVIQLYLTLLQGCSNPETLEAAAGAIQNLAACYWQPSIEIRAAVRKEKGLPILVELLRMEVDRVVCAVATALRNLALDQRNKELIGKYAMRDLVQKLPPGNPQHDQATSDDTIAAVLATINEVIRKNVEFSRSLLDAGGVDRLMNITRQRQKYSTCVLKFSSQVLFTMWQHQELREVYKKQGWKESDFVTKTIAAKNAAHSSPNNVNNTLNRPMASQGRTRYEDKTLKRTPRSSSEVSRAQNNTESVDGSIYAKIESKQHIAEKIYHDSRTSGEMLRNVPSLTGNSLNYN